MCCVTAFLRIGECNGSNASADKNATRESRLSAAISHVVTPAFTRYWLLVLRTQNEVFALRTIRSSRKRENSTAYVAAKVDDKG